ncbi:YhgE/Pip domain-containing protein [Adlercreutzia sp. R25]|uniref:YhgE/Pip domain-containing protein n=1 Tax=Adlercreutzia shanghongiae TaxID=3111773 RepID=A0ABU6IV68_9ACTN|nr:MULTISPECIES: YhgE/Pip domain-containing protein [unclassified Adlercreutzia]MEC4271990.1 YhgE/Pip domain-containing protein [Adlercreutzia sp. R25]MEC4293721.1 YhgE/Pip domain-containing protein [Adlercreutzia sp. R22]
MSMMGEIFLGDVRNLFKNVIAAIVVVGLMLVPPLYAWFTTLGFWDPYDNTGNIKVAVASADEGYASDLIPTRINAGDQVVSALRANDQFDWQFVSEDDAVEGVRSGEYYAALVIPKSFSADLMTVFSDHVTEATIVYYDNEKENAIAQRVTSTGASTLQETIDETFAETVANVALGTTSSLTSFMSGEGILTYAQTLGTRLESAVGELEAAADQAGAYADLMGSTGSLVKATASILDEAGKAPDATTPLIDDARSGLASAEDGLAAATEAADAALSEASASYDAVTKASNDAFDTMKNDPAAARELLARCRQDVEALSQAYQTMRETLAGVDPASPALATLDRAIAELGTLSTSLKAAEDTVDKDAASIESAHDRVESALANAHSALNESKDTYNNQLRDDLSRLSASLQQVGDDTEALTDSLKSTALSLGSSTDALGGSLEAAEASLRKTADTLGTAAAQLSQARDDLSHAISTGDINEVRRIIGNNPSAVAKFLAAPTKLERHAVYPMANNGSAMSPFYTSLCLWIGAIFMVALMSVSVSPARQNELTGKYGRAPRKAELYLGRYGVFCLIGLAQALIVGLGNVFFLGVECEHLGLYLLACCLASVVFTNLVYTLTVSFGNIGKALAIIGLVLQLAGAGGLMPVQMLSAPLFQDIYPWLPFAHSMPALEGAMAGIYGDQYLMQMGLLAAFLVPSLILGLVLRRPVIRLNDWVLAKLDETKFL